MVVMAVMSGKGGLMAGGAACEWSEGGGNGEEEEEERGGGTALACRTRLEAGLGLSLGIHPKEPWSSTCSSLRSPRPSSTSSQRSRSSRPSSTRSPDDMERSRGGLVVSVSVLVVSVLVLVVLGLLGGGGPRYPLALGLDAATHLDTAVDGLAGSVEIVRLPQLVLDMARDLPAYAPVALRTDDGFELVPGKRLSGIGVLEELLGHLVERLEEAVRRRAEEKLVELGLVDVEPLSYPLDAREDSIGDPLDGDDGDDDGVGGVGDRGEGGGPDLLLDTSGLKSADGRDQVFVEHQALHAGRELLALDNDVAGDLLVVAVVLVLEAAALGSQKRGGGRHAGGGGRRALVSWSGAGANCASKLESTILE